MPRKAKAAIPQPPSAQASSPLGHENPAPVFALGKVLKIDTAAVRGQRFLVDEIRVWSGGSTYPFLDHVLVNIPRLNPPRPARIRLMANRDSIGTVNHRIAALTLYDEFPFNERLLDVVQDTTKKLMIDDDADPMRIIHEEFWRVNDAEWPHTCEVTANTGDDRSLEPSSIQFWNYSRLIDVEGIETEEFIFVEMNVASGWFQIWRGIEVAPGQVACL